MNTSAFRRRAFLGGGLALLLLAGLAGGYALHHGALGSPEDERVHDSSHPEDSDTEAGLTVKVIRPRLNDRDLLHTVTQPVYVQGFYKADLMARVAGSVKRVTKNIGDRVKAGEVLIELDVPDLEKELGHKDAVVSLTEQEARAAQVNVKSVQAAEKEAAALVREKLADVDRAASKQKYHAAVYHRVRKLAQSDAVEPALVDERLKNLEAAEADYKSALVAVDSARANLEEFEAKLAAAKLDVEVKKARVAVARADRNKAQAMVDYLHIKAPFDGIVVSRRVDPGAFVQNASTGNPTPLLTVLRTDRVTLVMWVPERETAFVTQETEAIVRLDALRTRELRARVSRLANFLDPEKSRDMRVEVDVDNSDGALKAGMYGSMTLVLQRFERALLVPASAVFVRNGRSCICEVVDGRARIIPVRVQQEDGVRVKLVKLLSRPGANGSSESEVPVELSGTELIVRSGQGEIRDGQEVRITPIDW